MAKVLQKIFNVGTDEINQTYTIESWHVSQSIDALTGAQDYDITISGSLAVTGAVNINGSTTISGSTAMNGGLLVTSAIIGSLTGTASWATNARTASFLPVGTYNITASWAQSASNAINSQTASFLPIGTYNITSSWAQSASNAINARTASFLPVGTYNITASWAQSASNALNAITASHALTASFYAGAQIGTLAQVTALGAVTAVPITASIISASNGITGSLFGTASWAVSSSRAISSSFAITASHALNTTNNGNMLFTTASTFTTQSKSSFYTKVTSFDIGGTSIGVTPTYGDVYFNTNTKSNVTQIRIANESEGSTIDITDFLSGIVKGSKLYFLHPTHGEGFYTSLGPAGGTFGTPGYYDIDVMYVSHSGNATWTATSTNFTSMSINNPLNVNLSTGYNQLTFSGSQNLSSTDYLEGGYLTVRLSPNINNKPGDITVLEYSNTSEADVRIDLQYAARSGSEPQSNLLYTYDSSPIPPYTVLNSTVPPLLISSSERGSVSFMTIKYASGSSTQLGFMKLGFENVKLT
jgi:hypothetical protein